MTTSYDLPPSDFPPPPIPMARPLSEPPPVARAIGFGPLLTRGQAVIDLFLILAFFFLLQVAIDGIGLREFLGEHAPSLELFGINIFFGGSILAVIGCIVALRGQSVRDLGLVRTSPGRVILGTVLAIPACYAAVFVTVPLYVLLSGQNFEGMAKERSEFFEMVPTFSFRQAVLLSVIVGVHEEVLFRGFILGRLRSLFRSNIAAAVISSVVFGLLHFYQGPIGVVQTATVGMVFAMVVIRTGSLWPAIVAHAAFDTIGLSLIPVVQRMIQDMQELPASAPTG